jgi:hypothetical protein
LDDSWHLFFVACLGVNSLFVKLMFIKKAVVVFVESSAFLLTLAWCKQRGYETMFLRG